jgi:DNA-binding transcriptional LysR family regulator
MTRITRSPLLDRFHARHPDLRVEFVMSDKYLDIAKGDADVALRSGNTDADELVGRKVAESVWAAYASRDYVARQGAPKDAAALRRHALVGFDETMSGHRAAQWLRKVAPDAAIAARVNSVLGLVAAAKAGLGVAPLPVALGDAEADLVQVLPPVADMQRDWRLLTHPDLRNAPRIAAFFDFVASELDTLRPILSG